MNRVDFLAGLNMTFGKGGLAAGTTSTLTAAAAFTYSVGGKMYTKTVGSNTASPTVDANGTAFVVIPAGKGAAVLTMVNAAGTLAYMQGPQETVDVDGDFKKAVEMPSVPDGNTVFGMIILKNATTGTDFTTGTSNWAQTGITDTFTDLATRPDRPQVA